MPVVPSLTSPADSLPHEQQAIRTLIDLLHQEQAILIGADMDGLSMVTERKVPILAEISELAFGRHRSLAAAGFPGNEAGMQAWIETKVHGKPAYPAANAAWTALLAMARQAKEINRVNGMLVTTHLTRNQSALSVLQIQTSTSNNVYGPDGQTASRGLGRGLALG